MAAQFERAGRRRVPVVNIVVMGSAALAVIGLLVWQGAAAHGAPDPAAKGLSAAAVVLSSAVLVFREGLEAILVLAAVTAGLIRSGKGFERGVAAFRKL